MLLYGDKMIFDEKDIIDICNLYTIEKMNMSEIAKQYGTYPLRIRNILTKNGIKIVRFPKKVNKFLKEDFFEDIKTEEQAYWLGVLFTDGSIVKKKDANSYTIRLDVQEQDIDLINKFKTSLNSNGKITRSKHTKNGKTTYSVLTTISSNKMSDDLAKYGIIPNKTYLTNTLPKVSKELIPHLLRGLIDGDGSIYTTQSYNLDYNKYYKKNVIYFCSYHKQCCQEFLEMTLPLLTRTNKMQVVGEEKTGMYRISFTSQQDIFDLCNKLYLNSHIYLDRKYKKAMDILNINHQ